MIVCCTANGAVHSALCNRQRSPSRGIHCFLMCPAQQNRTKLGPAVSCVPPWLPVITRDLGDASGKSCLTPASPFRIEDPPPPPTAHLGPSS